MNILEARRCNADDSAQVEALESRAAIKELRQRLGAVDEQSLNVKAREATQLGSQRLE